MWSLSSFHSIVSEKPSDCLNREIISELFHYFTAVLIANLFACLPLLSQIIKFNLNNSLKAWSLWWTWPDSAKTLPWSPRSSGSEARLLQTRGRKPCRCLPPNQSKLLCPGRSSQAASVHVVPLGSSIFPSPAGLICQRYTSGDLDCFNGLDYILNYFYILKCLGWFLTLSFLLSSLNSHTMLGADYEIKK